MLVAVDVETTGLRPEEGHLLLEIYVSIREETYPFHEVGPGFHRVIQHNPVLAYSRANDVVQEMHNKTGLWEKLQDGSPIEEVDRDLQRFLAQYLEPRQGRITGNSVRLDMNFMDTFLPKSFDWLHYRFLDVTGLSWFAHTSFDVPYYVKQLEGSHTAQGDVQQMIDELRHVRREIDLKMELGREGDQCEENTV